MSALWLLFLGSFGGILQQSDFPQIHNSTNTSFSGPTRLSHTTLNQFEGHPALLNTRIILNEFSDESLVLRLFNTVTLTVYERVFTPKHLANFRIPEISTIAFLKNLLLDAFHDKDPNILHYTVQEGHDGQTEYIRFNISNTYRYSPFDLIMDIPRKTLDDDTKIQLRLDKVLSENEQLRKTLSAIQAEQQALLSKYEFLVSEVTGFRSLERHSFGLTMEKFVSIAEKLFAVAKSHWEKTRSFGGLDLVVPTSASEEIQLMMPYCDSQSPTYRNVAVTVIKLYEKNARRSLKSFHLPLKESSGAQRIVHALSKEKAIRVEVTLVVPKDIVFSPPDDCTVNGPPSTIGMRARTDASFKNVDGQCSKTSIASCTLTIDCLKKLPVVMPHTLDGTKWIIKWNKVDEWWELEPSNLDQDFQYWTVMDLYPEWRAQGVVHKYKVLEFEEHEEEYEEEIDSS